MWLIILYTLCTFLSMCITKLFVPDFNPYSPWLIPTYSQGPGITAIARATRRNIAIFILIIIDKIISVNNPRPHDHRLFLVSSYMFVSTMLSVIHDYFIFSMAISPQYLLVMSTHILVAGMGGAVTFPTFNQLVVNGVPHHNAPFQVRPDMAGDRL